jgi:hypothetical protein
VLTLDFDDKLSKNCFRPCNGHKNYKSELFHVESARIPCGIIHAEFAQMLTCKLDMQSVRTSTESARTNTESVRTNTESVCTFAGKVGIFTESTESVWSVRNPCGTPGGV